MGRILKLIGIVVGAIFLLFVAALVVVGLLFDPNDYKDQITAAVANATGRQLSLPGDLELAVFPTVRIAIGEATLSNAEGFGEQPFARIGGAQLRVSLLPLLSRRIEIDEARLAGLELNLARDARGRNNWQDLGGGAAPAEPAAPAAPAASEGGGSPLDLDVGAVEIADARVTWTDAGNGSNWVLDRFGLEASDFGPGRRFPLAMQFSLSGADVAVDVNADMQATLALAENAYRLEDLNVRLAGRGAGWPGGEGNATLAFESLAANLNDESVELTGLVLDFLGITMAGSLSGQRLLSDLALSGAVDIREFNPRTVLETFGVAVDTADGNVLQRASAKANLLYTSSQLGLRDMQLALDDSQLTGRVGLENEALRFSLSVNDIDIDRYLPPSAESDAPAEEGSLDEVDLPLEVLRTTNASGDLKFGRAKFSGMTLTDAEFVLNASGGRAQLRPSASLYGGRFSGDIIVQAEGDAARITVAQVLDDVDLASLGRDLLGSEDVTGTGDVTLNLAAAGTNLGQVRRDLDGDVAFTVTNGTLEGFDLWYELRRARARLDGVDIPERGDVARRTPFSSLTATGTVQDALLTNRDLTGVLDFMRIDGMGTVNLLDDMINFDLRATFVDGPTLQSDPDMAKLAGQSMPLRATGTLDAPSVLPDFGALVRQQVTERVNERVEEEREEAQEEVRERVRDRLRGLLDRD